MGTDDTKFVKESEDKQIQKDINILTTGCNAALTWAFRGTCKLTTTKLFNKLKS